MLYLYTVAFAAPDHPEATIIFPLLSGTAAEVTENVRKTLKIMMDGYGYHFAPAHAIQDNTPTENAIAMYQAAHTYGIY